MSVMGLMTNKSRFPGSFAGLFVETLKLFI